MIPRAFAPCRTARRTALKPSFILAAMLAITIYFAPQCEAQNRPAKDAHVSAQETNRDVPVNAPYQINNQWISAEAQPAGNQSPHWYKSPEWILVIVGCITFLVIGWQSFETRRAATATRDAALAASRSVDVLIDSERAWVVPAVSNSEVVRMSPGAIRPFNQLLLTLKNKGKTVARVTVLDAAYKLIPKDALLPVIPEYPETSVDI